MKRMLIALALLISGAAVAQEQRPLPHPVMTPGHVMTTDRNVFCVVGYTKTVRKVSDGLKERVYHNYGITHEREPYEFKVDHLISLQLGGSNDIRNLWPVPLQTQPWNGYRKDRLENRLKKLVCSGKMRAEEAQHRIATDWTAEYIRQFGHPATH